MTEIASLLRDTAAALGRSGLVSSQAEARTLVSLALGVEPARLVLVPEVTSAQKQALADMVAQRVAGRPLQHITGEAYFRTVTLAVGPGVFIPRPETEVLAGWAISQVEKGQRRVVELCAGSGAISLAIMTESDPEAVWAVERDEVACQWLARNLEGTGAQAVCADMAEALHHLDGSIDIVVANPPYVPTSQRDLLPADVGHDPAAALFSGPVGLDDTVTVARVAGRLLRGGGVVGSEHGEDQGEGVAEVLAAAGFVDISCHADLAGRPRFTTARKPNHPTIARSAAQRPACGCSSVSSSQHTVGT
ncbi:MAG: peptide chain release factor N(5)-glutamine methyltransferase [Propionibacteriaceae bacterium]|nr:peptide chain release factor N(5)-glutamine methyltransferase [Propionibacteriaceae bacterium]